LHKRLRRVALSDDRPYFFSAGGRLNISVPRETSPCCVGPDTFRAVANAIDSGAHMNPTLWLLTALIAGLLITWAYRVASSIKVPQSAPERPQTVDSQVDAKLFDEGGLLSRTDRDGVWRENQANPAEVDQLNARTIEAKAQAAARHDAYTGKRTANPYRGATRSRLWLASYQSTLVEHLDA
jgi:hypothetical protein